MVAILAMLSYPVLLYLALGTEFSPFNPASSWGLAAEHAELELEHMSHFVVAVCSALPLAIAARFLPARIAPFSVLASSLLTSLPYAVQPTHSFEANDGWLANYTWQLGAFEVALAPLLIAAAIAAISRLRNIVKRGRALHG